MRILGISSQFHDASVSVVDNGQIVFAGHSERYSRIKNDPFLNSQIIAEALGYGRPDVIALHEKSWAKKARNIYARNFSALEEPSTAKWINEFYPQLKGIPIKEYWHHETHAAAGVMTSQFDECAVMVIDAIGEFDTATIWHWKNNKLKKKHSVWFPSSVGLFYSAVTAHVGLKPMEDEYILMGMAAYGKPQYAETLEQKLFKGKHSLKTKRNLQRGLPQQFTDRHLQKNIDEWGHSALDYDLAASAQKVVENKIYAYAQKAQQLTGSKNLVYMGGVALNCVANSGLFNYFDKVHIMPNPGDAGSSLGAAALHYHRATGRKVDGFTPYLGTEIAGKYPVNKALNSLLNGEIFGIANGRAEYGPRALGNRSLCADPRGSEIKDRMNVIKKRQKFRPFAPMIMQQFARDYFEMPGDMLKAPYMQYTAKCKQPEKFPAIVHADGTSRVQTVNPVDHPELHTLLSRFHSATGCPMIVNTSLNIKGQPIVNTETEAQEFSKHYGVPVHTRDD